jgi:N6-adenosine-specific RNA methylase IME4
MAGAAENFHEIELEWGGTTPNAIKVREDAASNWFFLPKSQVSWSKNPTMLGRVTVTIPEWLLIARELEHLV